MKRKSATSVGAVCQPIGPACCGKSWREPEEEANSFGHPRSKARARLLPNLEQQGATLKDFDDLGRARKADAIATDRIIKARIDNLSKLIAGQEPVDEPPGQEASLSAFNLIERGEQEAFVGCHPRSDALMR